MIDTTTNTVTTTIPVGSGPVRGGGRPRPPTAPTSPTSAPTSVSVIDTTTNTVTTTIPVGKVPYGVAVDPTTHSAYVTNYGGNSVSVIDTTTNTVTTTIPVGSGPYGVAVDPDHPPRLRHQPERQLGVGHRHHHQHRHHHHPRRDGAYGVAVDPTTHSVYVTHTYASSVSVVQEPASTPAPEVTDIAPATGPRAGGTEVVITGSDFTDATDVVFGSVGAASSFRVDSAHPDHRGRTCRRAPPDDATSASATSAAPARQVTRGHLHLHRRHQARHHRASPPPPAPAPAAPR